MKKNIIIALLMAFMIPFLSGVSLAILTPAVDGHYHYGDCCTPHPIQVEICEYYSHIYSGIEVYAEYGGEVYLMCFTTKDEGTGIIEFNISRIDGLFASGQMRAVLALTVKDGDLPKDHCLSFYSIQDVNENGMVEEVDIDTEDYIGEICRNLQSGDILFLDVTSALEHDLFDPDQTEYSGFIIKRSTFWEDSIEFYDHTDPAFAPRLSISERLCPVTAIYDEHSEQTALLRSIRDNVLSRTHEGRELIRLYYQWSPFIVKAMEADEDFKADVRALVDGVLGMIEGE